MPLSCANRDSEWKFRQMAVVSATMDQVFFLVVVVVFVFESLATVKMT